jgi:hypothetical protein
MEPLLWILIAFLVGVIAVFWRTVQKLASKNLKLELAHNRLIIDYSDLHRAALYYQKACDRKTKELTSFDETTAKLIALAVSSHSENEARTAALQACKRIKKVTK